MTVQPDKRQVEDQMVPRLVATLYPVLIPLEQQDMYIQARNHELVTQVAKIAWRFFIEVDDRNRRMVLDALGDEAVQAPKAIRCSRCQVVRTTPITECGWSCCPHLTVQVPDVTDQVTDHEAMDVTDYPAVKPVRF